MTLVHAVVLGFGCAVGGAVATYLYYSYLHTKVEYLTAKALKLDADAKARLKALL